ncbi:hypothetical protein [uncultured Nostoc sp.]|uniref:hypothetical protein n=1 Tax=uncultured Nostoc sp. TaxID=340711 RepID=UPI0035CC6B84
MRYSILLRGVGARHCRAPTRVPHINENRYILSRTIGELRKQTVQTQTQINILTEQLQPELEPAKL